MPDWNGRKMLEPPPQFVIETDASLRGWGAYSCGTFTGGCWSQEEALLHINVLEMLAVLYGIKSFVKGEAKVKTILIKSDNITVVSYLNHMGGTKSQTLIETARQVWEWCLQRNITLSAQYLPRLENVRADFLSRYLTDRTDWHLNPTIVQAIDRLWGPLEVDLFATRLTAQLPRFFSWRPDPEAEAVDQNQGFCSSAMVAHSLTPTTYTAPERNLGLHCSSVANTVMVPYSTVPVDRLTSPSSTLSEHDPAIPQLRQPPTAVTTATGCMEGLQQQFAAQGIPQEHLSCHP